MLLFGARARVFIYAYDRERPIVTGVEWGESALGSRCPGRIYRPFGSPTLSSNAVIAPLLLLSVESQPRPRRFASHVHIPTFVAADPLPKQGETVP